MDRSNFSFLSDEEWAVIVEMVDHLGQDSVIAILHLPHEAIKLSIARYSERTKTVLHQVRLDGQDSAVQELNKHFDAQAVQHQQTIANLQRQLQEKDRASSEKIRIEVAKYRGNEGENLPRWKVEVKIAIFAAGITDPQRQVAFAVSNLGSRAKEWAYGRIMADPGCFPAVEDLFEKLEAAFQPPKSEFRLRTQFLNLRQGKRDLYSYIQEARYLVASISKDPLEEKTKLTVFLNGLNQGPIRSQLYREDLDTMEEAIASALEEDFSIRAASREHGVQQQQHFRKEQKHVKPNPSSSQMELNYIQGSSRNNGFKYPKKQNGFQKNRPVDKSKILCRRCKKPGHYASECFAPAPVVSKSVSSSNVHNIRGASNQSNGRSQ